MSSSGRKRALATMPVFGGTMALSVGPAGAVEKAAYRLTAQVNTLSLRQDFGEVAVVESGVLVAGQDDRGGIEEKNRALDEFVPVTGYHRKHRTKLMPTPRTRARQAVCPAGSASTMSRSVRRWS